MSVYNGKITAPLNLSEVYGVLGVSRQNGVYSLAYICSNVHNKINKWAKFKPEAVGGISPITLQERKNNNFGLKAGTMYATIEEFAQAVSDGVDYTDWVYTPPQKTSYKRLSDFNGYNHNARPPFGTLPSNLELVISSNESDESIIYAVNPAPGDTGALDLLDFQAIVGTSQLKDWYFGIMILDKDFGNIILARTATLPISDGMGWSVNLGHIPDSTHGLYIAVPFLSNKILNGVIQPTGNSIISTGQDGVTIHIKWMSDNYTPYSRCYYIDKSKNALSYLAQITNNTNNPVILNNVVLAVGNTLNATSIYPIAVYESITIAANSVWTIEGTETVPYNGTASSFYQYHRLQYDGGSTGWLPMMEAPTT